MSSRTSPSARGSRRIGRCQLFEPIAHGGMAMVHLGRWLGMGGFRKVVAVKTLHPELSRDPELVTMFLDEARVAGRIQHPNVVPVIDMIEERGQLYIVMDYVPGVPLTHLMARVASRGRGLPVAVVKRLMCDVLHGLHAAHSACDERGEPLGVIHRDVSPGNVLVGADGHARVLDFGVARAAGRLTQTQTGVIKGKLVYMAPEQLQQGRLSRRTDVYGASVVMWQALTGCRLFDARNAGEAAMQVLEARVPPPSELVEGLDRALEEIVMRGLQRAPELRWRSAEHMAEAIEATGGLASHRAVADWLGSVAAEELARRAALVRRVERAEVVQPPSTAMARSARRSPRRRATPRAEPRRLLRPSTPPPRRRFGIVLQALFVVAVAVVVTLAIVGRVV